MKNGKHHHHFVTQGLFGIIRGQANNPLLENCKIRAESEIIRVIFCLDQAFKGIDAGILGK